MCFVTGQLGEITVEFDQLSVDDGAGKPLGGEIPQEGVVGALAAPYHRSENLETGLVGQLEHPIHDLLWGLADQLLPGFGIVGYPDPCEQKPKVVVDLGDGADRGPRVATGRLLVDRDGG